MIWAPGQDLGSLSSVFGLATNSCVHKDKAFRKCFVTLINVKDYVGNFQLKSITSECECFRTSGLMAMGWDLVYLLIQMAVVGGFFVCS